MFDLPILMWGATARAGIGQWTGEAVATFGLVITILACVRFRPEAVAAAVGLYITAAYWFTSSTSFANPAVTVARALTDSFAGIRPADVARIHLRPAGWRRGGLADCRVALRRARQGHACCALQGKEGLTSTISHELRTFRSLRNVEDPGGLSFRRS